MSDPLWVFGYGSLVWRPAFDYVERRPASVAGWQRRFWQGSPDHRGVPGKPGRVVTLVPTVGSRCAGMAYRVAPGDAEAVFARLDHREQGGYDRYRLRLHFVGGGEHHGITYVAPVNNAHYLGPAPLAAIAEQVRGSAGPSGPNDEYVHRLADALRRMGVVDTHVFALERLLRAEQRAAD